MAIAEQSGGRADALLVHRRALPGIGGLTGRVFSQLAVETFAASDDEGHHHAVARPQVGHAASYLLHDPHELMAQNVTGVKIGNLSTV